MKKRTKILTAAIVCFVSAGLSFGGAAACGFFEREKWAEANAAIAKKTGYYETPQKGEYAADGAVTALDIDAGSADLVVRAGDADAVRVEYYDRFPGEYEIALEDGRLTVKQTRKWSFWEGFGLSWVLNLFDGDWSDHAVTVTVPADAAVLETLTLETDSGFVECAGLSATGALAVKADSGRIAITGGGFGGADIRASSGAVTVSDCGFDSADIRASNGRVAVNGANVSGLLKIRADSGGATVENASADTLDIDVSNGNIALNAVKARAIQSKADSGRTEWNAVECDTFTGRSSSGRVKLTDCAIQTIDYISSNGDFTVTNLAGASAATAALDIRASSGKITVFGDGKSGKAFNNNLQGQAAISIKVKLSSGSFTIEGA
ncbi:MAG: DUF4097 domain-containing protein [Clostridiales bacterium]|jgi:DUF4097 and DUF4098 domain-containing protein YvlB|nr:DUF4097 domain-containing protein [Clostridiales bacterium]